MLAIGLAAHGIFISYGFVAGSLIYFLAWSAHNLSNFIVLFSLTQILENTLSINYTELKLSLISILFVM